MKTKRVQGVYGKRRVLEGYKHYRRLFVLKTNVKTWILSLTESASLDTMVEVAGEYHFGTLAELHTAVNQV